MRTFDIFLDDRIKLIQH